MIQPLPRQEAQDVPRAGVEVCLRGVRRVFDAGHRVTAVDGVDLDISAGSFVALLGPSGCGKSTLLRLIAGLDRPTAGEVSLNPKASRSSKIAYVFQDPQLLPWRRVLDNAALPLELSGAPPAERRDAALAALAQVGLKDAADRFPSELSGGMKMRASLARALVTRPSLLLLDEPFAALDELTRHRLDDQLHALWEELPMTVLFVTHAITEATYLAERAIVFSSRPARVIADHRIALPSTRTPLLRAEPAFHGEARVLLEALERAGA